MSDSGTAGPRQFPAKVPAHVPGQAAAPSAVPASAHSQTPAAAPVPVALPSTVTAIPHPVAMLVVDALTGAVTATNPAGRRVLAGPSGMQLSRWLHAVAMSCADGVGGETTVRVWRGIDAATVTPVTLWAQCTPVTYRSHPSVLIVLREDVVVDPAQDGAPDPTRAVFTMDAVGRVDTWGPTAQQLTGFAPAVVLGSDTTLLHTGPARLAAEQHRALTEAYRHGEHRSEGWRVCADGRLIWAEVVTCALHDGLDRLLGFAVTVHDLTERRRLTPSAVAVMPSPRAPHAVGPARPTRATTSRPGPLPAQRRSNGLS